MRNEPADIGILAIDIEGFGRPTWTDPFRIRVRERLHHLLDGALEQAGIDHSVAYRIDTGDGLLLLVGAEVSTARLLHPVATTLASSLADENRQVPPAERIRLRVVVHAGAVLPDVQGFAGESLNHAVRLLGTAALRAALDGSPAADMVLVVSELVYSQIVRNDEAGIDPADWQPVWARAAETRARAWLRVFPSDARLSLAETEQGPEAGLQDQVAWVSDAPAERDVLQRQPLAQVLAMRLEYLHAEEPDTSFLVHVDGPWGAGKSTIMNLLREELRPGWLAVGFDAWREARIGGPPWWALLAALRHSMGTDRGVLARLRLRVAEAWARLRRTGAPFTLALVMLLGLATGAFLLLRPRSLTLTTTSDLARTATAVVTALGTLWAGALVAGRFLLWDSAKGARLFEQSNTNPMQDVADHFDWLTAKVGKPVIFFIDDLDRCDEGYVVELLDTVQTLIRDGPRRRWPRRGARPGATYFVVAADGSWIRTSYEAAYAKFTAPLAEPGRPLGYLFLDKLFQLRVPVPTIDATGRDGYLRALLFGLDSGAVHDPAEEQQTLAKVQRSRTEREIVEALREASPTVRSAVAGAAAALLSAPSITAATEHSLQRFHALLYPNPRSIKRFLNAYGMLRAVRTLEANPVPSEPLALWTILETRWPSLADYLRGNPEAVELLNKPPSDPDLETIPVDIRDLFTDTAVQRLASFEHGGPLTPVLVRACCGAAIFEPPAGPNPIPSDGDGL